MSKSSKKDVGKGIRALLSNIEKGGNTEVVKKKFEHLEEVEENELSIKLIEPNPFQPRKEFNEEELKDLIQSVKTHGIIQPIAVRRLNASSYQIISGERRYRAAKALKLKTVPVHILKVNDQSMLEIALLENIQRSDLNPIEIAISYQRLIDECKLTHEELSERLGKKRSSISNYLRVLKLSPSVQESLKNNQISLGHAKALGGISEIEIQTFLLGKILSDELSVRATEQLIKSYSSNNKTRSKQAKNVDPLLNSVINRLSEHLGSKVRIKTDSKGKGVIQIPFGSNNELNDIIDLIIDS